MKRTILTFAFSVLVCSVCSAQLSAPVQTDTLIIKTMKYQYHEIRPENWPFSSIVWEADSFTIDGKVFEIESSYSSGLSKTFRVSNGGKVSTLELTEKVGEYVISFSDYTLTCEKPGAASKAIGKVSTTVKEEVIPAVTEGFNTAKDAVKEAAGEAATSIKTALNRPVFELEGRMIGKTGLKKPMCTVNESGKVVVDIWVDQSGKVVKAIPGAEGTTISSNQAWSASRTAALETMFNRKSDAPALQRGSITYSFNLK